MKRRRAATFPLMVVVRCFLLVSWLWFAVPWVWGMVWLDGESCYHMTPASAAADLKSIRVRLAVGQDERMHALFPEGRLFSHSFYGFTLINLAAANSQDGAFRQQVLTELEALIPHTEKLGEQKPFDADAKLTPKGGVIAAGQVNLLRAGYAVLGGKDAAILAEYHAHSQVLFDAFGRSPVASLESYPGEIWPVDNVAALESLRLHDALYKTHYVEAADRWAAWMGSHLDPATGMMNMQITFAGDVRDGPRGCGLSWTLAFLPNLAPDLARRQYELYRAGWFQHPLGTTGIREFPVGRNDTFMDSDTGPIFFGLGTAATGFGIAAAKANHDVGNLTGLLRALELCSIPTYSLDLSRSRFFGQVLLADELALWGKTLCRWDAPAQFPPAVVPAAEMRHFWVVILATSASSFLLAWLLGRSLVGALRNCRKSRPMGRVHGAFLIAAVAVVAAFVVIPTVHWVWAVLALGILEMVETRSFGRKSPEAVIAAEQSKD